MTVGEGESGSSVASRSAYLHIGSHDGRPFRVDANIIATGRTCVLGSSGSGKSYTVGVICEELCKNRVPFLIIDTEGEYSGLKAKYEVLWLGEDEGADLSWSTVNIEELAKHAPDIPPLVVDVSETDDPKGKVSALLTALYREISNQRVPYL
ncbi:MAG: ATP-binding protein, partial [Thaumarchaeota archaeon]|nr:ATP-binding protein [Nitrososphaerota archaeon]